MDVVGVVGLDGDVDVHGELDVEVCLRGGVTGSRDQRKGRGQGEGRESRQCG